MHHSKVRILSSVWPREIFSEDENPAEGNRVMSDQMNKWNQSEFDDNSTWADPTHEPTVHYTDTI